MAIQFQNRRGTVSENNSFTGAAGEVVVDTTNNRLRVHDGATEGGFVVGGTTVINVKDFGAIGDGVADDTAAIQAAITKAESSITESVSVIFEGHFQVTSSISIGSASISLRGNNYYNDIIFYSGTGYLFDFAGGENSIDNLRLLGNATVSKSNNAINMGGNLTMNRAWFGGFDKAITWGGGYYHKYYGCKFIDINYPLDSFNGNNVLVSGCQFSTNINSITVAGGTGDFVVHGCSGEDISSTFLSQEAGSSCSFSISNTYFEGVNRIVTVGKSDLYFMNNNIQTGAMSRGVQLLGTDATFPNSLFAAGNKWIVDTDGDDDLEYAYLTAGTDDKKETIYINDTWLPIATIDGANIAIFVSGYSGFSRRGGFDALNNIDLSETKSTFTVTAAPSTSGSITLKSTSNTLAYVKQGSIVTITGKVVVDSVSSPVGSAVNLSNLPYSVTNLSEDAGVVGFTLHSVGLPDTSYSAQILEGSNILTIYLDASLVGANDQFRFSFSYITDE